MKKKLAICFALVAIVVFTWIAISRVVARRSAEKREVSYQAIFERYKQNLKPGISRRQVRDHLSEETIAGHPAESSLNRDPRWVTPHYGSVADDKPHPPADFVDIGVEKSTAWYCSEETVDVVFHYESSTPKDFTNSHDSDRLLNITMIRRGDGCL